MRLARAALAAAVVMGVAVGVPSAAGAASMSWTAPIVLDTVGGTGQALAGVACPSASQCTAVDGIGQEVTFNPAAPGTPTPRTVDSGDSGTGLTAIACPSSSQCTAVDNFGYEVTFNPAAPGSPVRRLIDFGHTLAAVACPSAAQCTAVDQDRQEVTFNPVTGSTLSRITLPGAYSSNLNGVACPGTGQCTAVGGGAVSGGGGGGQAWTFNPAAPGSPAPTTVDPGFSYWLTGVACPTAHQCTAVDDFGGQVTFDPAAPGTPKRAVIDADGYPLSGMLDGVACPSTTQCTAVGRYGRAVEGDPTATAGWTVQHVGPDVLTSRLTAIACISLERCVTVDQNGSAYVGTAPPPHTLTVSRAGDGGGSVAGTGISCPGTCSHSYAGGTTVTLTASPAPGSAFGGWSGGGCGGTGACTVTLNADRAVTATFTAKAPSISAFTLTNTRFAVGSRRTAVTAAATKVGTTFRYTLSAPSTTKILIERRSTGRRVGGRCVRRTTSNTHKRPCTLYTKAGTLTRAARQGANRLVFSGRIGSKALTRAAYRATATARIGAGPVSKPRTATFTIVRR